MKFNVIIIVIFILALLFYLSRKVTIENFKSRKSIKDIYGKDGINFDPKGPLLNYAYVGNLESMPNLSNHKIYNVKKFGAKGDGKTDDTEAFKRTIKRAKKNSVIYIPNGTYPITNNIKINKTLHIKGESENRTIIYFPKSKTELFGREKKSKWSFGTYFFQIRPKLQTPSQLANIISNKSKGFNQIYCDNVSNLNKNQWIHIVQFADNENVLQNILYQDKELYNTDTDMYTKSTKFINQIKSINKKKNSITLVYPLIMNVNTKCKPIIQEFNPNPFSIQNLTFKAKYKKYKGHFNEDGYNMLHIRDVQNGWFKNLTFHNSDLSFRSDNCTSNTYSNITCSGRRPGPKGFDGHHAIWFIKGGFNLFENFNINTKFVHDITVENGTVSNVFSNGKGYDINFDHHRVAPYGNLFTNIDIGLGTRYWASSGKPRRGGHSGAYTTFWKLYHKKCKKNATKCKKLPLPVDHKDKNRPFGSNVNLIGTFKSSKKKHFNIISLKNNKFYPSNIYSSMRKNLF